MADLNKDGKLDLIVLTENDETIRVAVGNGDGTFAAVLPNPELLGDDFLIGDVSGDGYLDVVATLQFQNWMGVAFGNGDGTFNPPTSVSITGPVAVGAADFNGDNKLDLLIPTTSSTVVMLGNGDGTFSQSQSLPLGCFAVASAVTGDFNGDRRADVAVGCYESVEQHVPYVALFLNQGNGEVQLSAILEIPEVVAKIAVGDVTGDGLLDVAVAGVLGTAYIVPGQGNSKLSAPYGYLFGANSVWLTLADLRLNGALDIIGHNDAGYDWAVLLNNGKGIFRDGVPMALAQSAQTHWAASGDIKSDGNADIAVATSAGVQILCGTGHTAAPFRHGAVIPLASTAQYVAVGDLNKDGQPDLAASVYNSTTNTWTVSVALALGNGVFGTPKTYPALQVGSYLGPLLIADLNGDGTPDLVATTGIMLGKGDGKR